MDDTNAAAFNTSIVFTMASFVHHNEMGNSSSSEEDDDSNEEQQVGIDETQGDHSQDDDDNNPDDQDMPDAAPRDDEEEEEEEEEALNDVNADSRNASPADGGESPNDDSAPLVPPTDEDDLEGTGEEEEDEMKTTDNEIGAVYSTRGRTADQGPPSDLWDTLARDADLHKEHHPPAAIGASFLSESLTEEERRTRTRYLPDVEGFHALRKHEVKSDLALARAIVSSSSSTPTVPSKKKRHRDTPEDHLQSLEADDGSPSEDDRSSSDAALRANAKVIEMGRHAYALPPTAFCAPDNGRPHKGSLPTEVEATTSFNPPRPPESVGPKKKHRMMRWEQHPASIEVDLANYRKTVLKTRQELKNVQAERDRLLAVDNHLRRNFLGHLQALHDEWQQLTQHLNAVQQECVSLADLLTSRTRSRGTGKTHVMRDVLTVLRTRGAEMEEKNVTFDKVNIPAPTAAPGVGGLGPLCFQAWDRHTPISATPPAAAWLVPGDVVTTPAGKGTVRFVSAPIQDAEAKEKAHKRSPRVGVELDGGKMEHFAVTEVQSQENPATYTDARLAQRWKGILETTTAFGPYLDVEGMQEYLPWDETGETDLDAMDTDPDDRKSDAAEEDETDKRPRLLPFGSEMIPTPVGRGAKLHETDLVTLDKQFHKSLYDGVGVLGRRDNDGVPDTVRELEDKKERFIRAKVRSLQLTNALLRQRHITKQNEKTLKSSQERSSRVEALVTEMRSDLGSLKSRLEEEVAALGIDKEEARQILEAHYQQTQ